MRIVRGLGLGVAGLALLPFVNGGAVVLGLAGVVLGSGVFNVGNYLWRSMSRSASLRLILLGFGLSTLGVALALAPFTGHWFAAIASASVGAVAVAMVVLFGVSSALSGLRRSALLLLKRST